MRHLVLAALSLVACGGSSKATTHRPASPPASALAGAPTPLHLLPTPELLAFLTPDHPLLLPSAYLIAARGDAITQERAGAQLAALAAHAAQDAWLAQVRASLTEPGLDPRAVDATAMVRQEMRLASLYAAMTPLRTPAVASHCESVLNDPSRAHFHRNRAREVLIAQGLRVAEPPPIAEVRRDAEPSRVAGAVDAGAANAEAPDGSVANASLAVSSFRSAFRSCYQLELRRDPRAQGRATLIARIGPTGAVDDVETSETTMSTELTRCFAHVVARADFAPPQGGRAVVTIPISFVRQ